MENRHCSACGKKLPDWSESGKCFECIEKALTQLFKKETKRKKEKNNADT